MKRRNLLLLMTVLILCSGWDEDLEFVWYSPRLTDEEWDTWYGEHAGS